MYCWTVLLKHLVNKARADPLCPLGTQQESHSIYMSCFHSRFARCAEGITNNELNFHNVQFFLDECLKSFIDNCLPLKLSTPIKSGNLSRKDLTSFPICSIFFQCFFLSRPTSKEFIKVAPCIRLCKWKVIKRAIKSKWALQGT